MSRSSLFPSFSAPADALRSTRRSGSRVPVRGPRRGRAGVGLPAIVLASAAAASLTVVPVTSAVATPSPVPAVTAPSPAPAPTVALPDGIRPEGVASEGSLLHVGSLADGRIWTVDLRTGQGRQLLPGVTGRQLRGMQVDRRTGLLWAAGTDGATGVVLAVDVRTGAVRHTVAVDGAVFLNDLVVGARSVWVTDSRVDRLTRVPLGRGGRPTTAAPSFLPISGDWPVVGTTRANGVRLLPDGSLVVAHSSAGGPFTVDPRTGEARRIAVSGGPGIIGGDGLVLRGSVLYVVRGASRQGVAVLSLGRTADGWVADWLGELTDPSLDVPTTATLAAGRLWTVNGRFGITDPDTAAYWLTGLPRRP